MNKMDEICLKALKQKELKQIFIYPFGQIGLEIKRYLIEKYGYEGELICVDEYVYEYNRKVVRLERLNDVDWAKGSSLLILASENQNIYYELRDGVRKVVPESYIFDYCPVNPLCYSGDLRVAALAIQANEIYKNNVDGAVAEAGVYRGEFAQYINQLFPSRKLYLFDSFEGFSSVSFDSSGDNYEQIKDWEGYKADTSVEVVLRRLPYPQNAVIRKGYVPDTLYDVPDMFAFVNLDMDLYMPTYEALVFFWERMSAGGYIFVHDINNWDGCGKAVRDFCEKYRTGYVCLNDRITAAIAKPLNKES